MPKLPRGFHGLTVGKLKAVLATIPDDTFVLKPGFDHSYIPVRGVELRDVELTEAFEFFEHYDMAVVDGEVIKALVVAE
jgi:hypothetical protein